MTKSSEDALRAELAEQLKRSFHPAFVRCQEVQDAKSHDYNSGKAQDDMRSEYHPYGDLSYLQMLHTKFKRIESLATLKREGKKPKFETHSDSVIDLINYASFYFSWLENQERQRLKEISDGTT